jgi:hypothetical protein
VYLPPGDPNRGKVMKGAPVSGSGYASSQPGFFAFTFPAADATPGPQAGMRRTTTGSFVNLPPYVYSYSYAKLRNDAGDFGVGKGFFSVDAKLPGGTPRQTVNFQNGVVASIKVTKGKHNFGGVMRLLGSYTTKVCYFYAGGCALGYGSWKYELIGDAAIKNTKVDPQEPFYNLGSVIDGHNNFTFTFSYYNTELNTNASYNVVPQRFPWTTGTVTVTATGRGPHKTFHVRKGSLKAGAATYQTIQLVSPILTQWLGQTPAVQFETGGIAVMNIQFVPEPGVIVGLLAGMSLLGVLYRRRS